MKNKESYYAIIPANVRYCKNLTANAKLLYGEITALCNKEGYCWATNLYFAKLYDKDKMTISVWVGELEKNGFIKCIIKNNNMRRIYITGGIEKSIRGYRKIYKGGIEKSIPLYNNTYNIKKNTVGSLLPTDRLFEDKIKKEFQDKCTVLLESTLRQKRKLYRKVNKKQWTKQFVELHYKLGVKKEEINKTLNWYVSHLGEEFVPMAYSAKTFCDKYPQIRDAMNRSEPEGPKIKITSRINKRKENG